MLGFIGKELSRKRDYKMEKDRVESRERLSKSWTQKEEKGKKRKKTELLNRKHMKRKWNEKE